jgi:hypothetical protein
MRSFPRFLLPCLPVLLLLLTAGCNYAEPVLYVSVSNNSGETMHNLVVQCPKGTFGLPVLRDGQTHRRMVPVASPCKFTISFKDAAGKAHQAEYDLGPQCRPEEVFEVGAGMKVTSRPGKK